MAYIMVLVTVPHANHPAIICTVSFCTNCAIVIGNISTDEAKMMGLSDFGILVYILVPCTLPSIISGTVLSLTRGLGEYGATAMLAGNIAGKTRTLPLAVYSAVAAGRMDEAWIYVVVILAVAFTAVFIMNCFGDRGGTVRL